MNSTLIVLFGGASDERLVSVASSQNVAETVQDAVLWYQNPKGEIFPIFRKELLNHKEAFQKEFIPSHPKPYKSLPDALEQAYRGGVFFLALHGGDGENGKVQELLEKSKIPFTGSASQASRLAMDKILAKKVAQKTGVAVTEELEFVPPDTRKVLPFLQKHGSIILKPVDGGSSIGLFKIQSVEALEKANESLTRFKGVRFLAEPFLQGTEVTVGVYDSREGLIALPPSEVRLDPGKNFDYEGKYLGKGSLEITPAQIPPAQTKAAQTAALKMHQALGCEGYTRTDLILTQNGPVYLETNTLPGLTKASFIPQQLAAQGIPFLDFIRRQIELAEARVEKVPFNLSHNEQR